MKDSEPTVAKDMLDGTGPTWVRGKDWSAKVPSVVAQDMRDGAAVRRLYEAAPEDWGVICTHFGFPEFAEFECEVYDQSGVGGGPGDGDSVFGHGGTMAEAAEHCLEALEEARAK